MSANKVYVGNLPYTFTKVDLTELFQGFGPVRSAEVIMDRETGRSRGFGFVEMETAEAMQQAIAGLHERNLQGRNLTVNEARERAPRAPGSFSRPTGGSFRPQSGPPRSFSGGGGGGGGAPRPWSDRGGDGPPRSDKGGGFKDRGSKGRGGDERDSGRGRRSKGWGDGDD